MSCQWSHYLWQNTKTWNKENVRKVLSTPLLAAIGPELHSVISWSKQLCFSVYLHPFFEPICCQVFNFLRHLAAGTIRLNRIIKVCDCGSSVLPLGWKLNRTYFICPFSLSSQREEDGERRRKQKTFDFGQAELPRYTAIDAVSWVCLVIWLRIHNVFHNLSPKLKVSVCEA